MADGAMAGSPVGGPALLGIYLNDHLAGATGGLELARRLARSQPGSWVGTAFAPLVAEIAEDRAALLDMMRALGVPVRRYKAYAAWSAEKLARLKPNGRLLRRSALSTVVELETMKIGVLGKSAGWRTLRTVAERDNRLSPQRLDQLLDRAERQADQIEALRVRAAAEAFTPLS
jgi:predicted DNA-binding ribbon-helix-helix protein